MISAWLIRPIPTTKLRLLTLLAGILCCIPALIIFGIQVTLAPDVRTGLLWASICAGTLLGASALATIAFGVYSGRKGALVIADLLIILSLAMTFFGIVNLAA